MPIIEHWNVEVVVTVRVTDGRYPSERRKVVALSAVGRSQGDNTSGLTAAVGQALLPALTELDNMTDNFRKQDRA